MSKKIKFEIRALSKEEGREERYVQSMIDTVVAMQKGWPMPDEGWKDFVASVEYTNKKRGWNLRIKLDED